MDEQTMPTLEELRGVIAHRKYVYDSHLMDMPVNWENITAIVSGIADAQNEYIDALEAERTAQQQRIEKLEAALEPFADDWHWFLDWNKRNPDHPKTHSEFSWLGQIDPVSYDDAFRRAYDLLHADEEDAG